MNKYPIFANGQVTETLDNNVIVTLKNGMLSIHAPNQFGADEEVYSHPITVDRTMQGPVFAAYGRQVEANVLHALHDSMLWKQIGNFSNHLHGRAAQLLTELTWFLPEATPAHVCCVAYRLNLEALKYFAQLNKELTDNATNIGSAFTAVVQENPLAVGDFPFQSTDEGGGTLYGHFAVYDMMFDVLIAK